MRFGFYSCCCVVLLLGARVARADGWGWIPEIRALEAERAALRMKLAGLPVAPPVQLTQRLGWHSEYGTSETKTEWVVPEWLAPVGPGGPFCRPRAWGLVEGMPWLSVGRAGSRGG